MQFSHDPTEFEAAPAPLQSELKAFATKLLEDEAKLYKTRENLLVKYSFLNPASDDRHNTNFVINSLSLRRTRIVKKVGGSVAEDCSDFRYLE